MPIVVPRKPKNQQKVSIGIPIDKYRVEQRLKFIAEKYSAAGGKPALERIKRHGRNEDREEISWYPWFEELVEALADFRLAHTLLTGSAQCGKTLANTLVEVDTIVSGRCQTAWFYADAQAVDLNVPDQFRPVLESWVESVETETGREFIRSGDRLINSRYEVEGVGGIFSFANTSQTKPSRRGKAAAGSKGVSFPADMVFYEERSQWLTNVDYSARMNASCLATHPTRELGTPGSGQGIEAGMQDCDRYFYPHYTCPHCEAVKPLDPKGCLLRPVLQRGKLKFLSPSGRPLKWFHHNEADAVQTAFIGCQECGEELPEETRTQATFRCKQTGVSLREFLDSLPDGIPDRRLKIGIHLSPLVKKTEFNLASELIHDGLTCGNSSDWQEQKLGHPSETLINSLPLEILKQALYAPQCSRRRNVRLAGIDQGRGQYWLWIADFCCPVFYESMPIEQVFEQTIQNVIWAGDIVKTAIPDRLAEYDVDFGVIDNEPERSDAAELSRVSCLVMADQRAGQMDDVKATKVITGGTKHPCWNIANETFLRRVLNSFLLTDADGYPLQRLPREWEKWLGNPSELSPLKHLSGPSYDPDSGKWERGAGNVDDIFYAAMFCQVAFYLWLTGKASIEYLTKVATAEERNTTPGQSRRPRRKV